MFDVRRFELQRNRLLSKNQRQISYFLNLSQTKSHPFRNGFVSIYGMSNYFLVTLTEVLRFAARPSSVSLEAIGCLTP
jgi:hypothetical protein